MKTKYLVGILCISWVAFALPAAAQNGRQTTPANSPMCDKLADATPGLQGLCVAMCEAQGCEAEVNPVTNEVDFGRNCEPSARRLLANYNRLAGPADPPMPCVKVACPCWTQADLEAIGGGGDVNCIGQKDVWMRLQSEIDGVAAAASFGACSLERPGSKTIIGEDLPSEVYAKCMDAAEAVCAARKQPLPE